MDVFDFAVVAGLLITLPSIGAWYDWIKERDAAVASVRADDIFEGYKVAALKRELATTDMTVDEFEQRLNALLVPALPKPIVKRVVTRRVLSRVKVGNKSYIPHAAVSAMPRRNEIYERYRRGLPLTPPD